jgi:hypothetical protein
MLNGNGKYGKKQIEQLMNTTLKDLWKYNKKQKQNKQLVNETLKYTTKYQTKRMYDKPIGYGCTKPMTKPH